MSNSSPLDIVKARLETPGEKRQVYADLVIAVAFISAWIHGDARSRVESPWPWIIAAFIVGVFPPLIYLLKAADRR